MKTRRNIKARKSRKLKKIYRRIRRGGEDPDLEEPMTLEPRPAMSTKEEFDDARLVMRFEKIKSAEKEQRDRQNAKIDFMSKLKSPFSNGGKTKKKKRKNRK
jgi:hypothetical protein